MCSSDLEIFSREQFLQWFDLDHLGKSAAQFDEAKLRWVNAQHLKAMDGAALAPWVQVHLQTQGVRSDERLSAICDVFKDRCDTTLALADWAKRFYQPIKLDEAQRAQHITPAIEPALHALADKLQACDWQAQGIAEAIKSVLQAQGLKMPQLAMPAQIGRAHV